MVCGEIRLTEHKHFGKIKLTGVGRIICGPTSVTQEDTGSGSQPSVTGKELKLFTDQDLINFFRNLKLQDEFVFWEDPSLI